MEIHWAEEIERLFESEAPKLQIRPIRAFRGEPTVILGVVYQAIVFGASIGAFGGLWKVCELLVQRFGSCRVKISYVAADGATVEIEYPQRTAAEAAAIAAKHPPSSPHEILIHVSDPSNARLHS